MTFGRTSQAVFAALIFLFINSCNDQPMGSAHGSINTKSVPADATVNPVANTFDKSVGKPIGRASALKWMENFNNANPGATKEYLLNASALSEIIANTSCVGISLHYAIDDHGSLHVLPIGVDDKGKMIPAQTIDSQSAKIDWQTAQQWIGNYTGRIQSHFFGTMTFTRLLAERPIQILASLATDDAGAQQLLLSNASNPAPDGYEDASRPCPPYCAL